MLYYSNDVTNFFVISARVSLLCGLSCCIQLCRGDLRRTIATSKRPMLLRQIWYHSFRKHHTDMRSTISLYYDVPGIHYAINKEHRWGCVFEKRISLPGQFLISVKKTIIYTLRDFSFYFSCSEATLGATDNILSQTESVPAARARLMACGHNFDGKLNGFWTQFAKSLLRRIKRDIVSRESSGSAASESRISIM